MPSLSGFVYTSIVKPILVTSYAHPDLDGIASAVAYAEFLQKTGRDAVAGIIGVPQVEADYLFDRLGLARPLTVPDADGYDEVILVDASDPAGLEGAVPVGKVIEVIDHRMVHESGAFPNARVQIELVGAAATLIAEKFMLNGARLSKDSAALLYAGIVSNTLNFKAAVTTDRDWTAAAWLNGIAGLPRDFWKEMFVSKSDVSGDKLFRRMRDDFKWFTLGGTRVGIAEIEMIGARVVVTERAAQICEELARIKEERRLDHVFQNTVELEGAQTFLLADDPGTQRLLQETLHVTFTGCVAELPYLLMRKQIVPELKKALERPPGRGEL